MAPRRGPRSNEAALLSDPGQLDPHPGALLINVGGALPTVMEMESSWQPELVEPEAVRPRVGCYSRAMVRHPRLMMAIMLTVILGLCATALLKPFTAPVNTGWSNRANAITQHLDAWWALERDHFRGRRLDDDWRTDTRDVITLIYEAAEGTSMFDPNQFERMVEMESRLLDIQYEDEGRTRRWSDECRLVSEKYPHPQGSGRCASPASILQLLYENSTLHEQECRAGYCATDLFGLDYAAIGCGNFTPWGSFPCFSSVFDWRSGTLAPRAEWAGLLTAGLTFFETVADEAANSPFSPRQMLSELRNVSVGAADLSSRYVRARYEVCREIDSEVHPLADAIDAVRDGLSQVQSDSRSTPKVHGGQVNIFWFSYEAVGLLAKVYFE